MKQAYIRVDRLLYGTPALVCALIGTVLLLVTILLPLSWRDFPDVKRIFFRSWLYLAIAVAIVHSALITVARRRELPSEILICLMIGLVWKLLPHFNFLNFSHYLVVYGLAGVTAHCIRRIRSKPGLEAPGRADQLT